MRPSSVQHTGRITGNSLAGPVDSRGEFTRILLRCSCGNIAFMMADGTWTLEQLRGLTAAGVSGDELLKQLESKDIAP